MFRLLIWNINNPEGSEISSPLVDALNAMVDNLDADIIALVEAPLPGSPVHACLFGLGLHFWSRPESRFAVFSKFSSRLVQPLEFPSLSTRYEAWKIFLPGLSRLNLFMVHGRDRRNHNPAARESDMRELAQDVQLMATLVGHDRTILMGDFNDRPFDTSLVRFDFLNSTNCRRTAALGVRQLRGRKSTPFYNPSWSLLSDVHNEVPGTYYLSTPEEDEMHWNAVDQFLIRPSLVPAFRAGGIRTVTKLGDFSLLGPHDRPSIKISDHLPVLLELDLNIN